MAADRFLYRASFNFTSKCNLSCRFCYIPFDGHSADTETSLHIVTRLVELGVTSVTFGGGDPLRNSSIVDLLHHARAVGVAHLQIDTNALGWASKQTLSDVASIVDVVGLPLDGATPEIHGAMRSHARSWSDSVSAAIFLRSLVDVKINTVVGAPNVDSLHHLTPLIAQLNPRIWSVYEFWAIGPVPQRNRVEFSLRPGRFLSVAENLRRALSFSGVEVEVGSIDDRSPSYFLVTDSGVAYAVDPLERTKYVDLGSVFDDSVLERWASVANTAHNRTRTVRRFNLNS